MASSDCADCRQCPVWWFGVVVLLVLLAALFCCGGDALAQTQTVRGDRLRIGPDTVPPTTDLGRFGLNASDYCDIRVAASGDLTLVCAGATPSITLGHATTITGDLTVSGITEVRDYLQNSGSANSGSIFLNDAVQVANTLYVGDAVDIRGAIRNTTGTPTIINDEVQFDSTIDARNAISNTTSNNGGAVYFNDLVTFGGGFNIDFQGPIVNTNASFNSGAVEINDDLDVRGTNGIANLGTTNSGNVLVNDNLTVAGGTLDVRSTGAAQIWNSTGSTLLTAYAGDVELAPPANIVTDPSSTFILPGSTYTDKLGSPFNKYLALYASELNIDTLVSREKVATTGGWLTVAPSTELVTPATPTDTTIYVKHNNLAQNDIVHLEARGQVEFMRINGAATPSYAALSAISNAASTGQTTASLSWQHTLAAGSNKALVIGVSLVPSSGQTVTSVAVTGFVDGIARYASRAAATSYGTTARAEVWYLIDPPEGLTTIVATLSASAVVYGGSVFVTGVDQRTPLRSYTTTTGTASPMALTLTTTANDLAFVAYGNSSTAASCAITSGETIQYQGTSSTTLRACGATETATGASTTVSLTASASGWAAAGLVLQPATTQVAYAVLRDQDNTGANQWLQGDAVHNLGGSAADEGWIELYAERSMRAPSSEFGPTIVVNRRNSTTYNDWSVRTAMGHLNGLYGKGANVFGFAAGDPSNANITVEDATGIQLRDGTTVKGQISNDGTFWFGDYSGGAGTGFLYWSGSALTIKGSITIVDSPTNNVAFKDLTNVTGNYAGSTAPAGSANNTLAVGTQTAAQVQSGVVKANTAIDGSNNVTTAVKGGVVAPTGSGTGLYLGSNYLGYYSGLSPSTLDTNLTSFWRLEEATGASRLDSIGSATLSENATGSSTLDTNIEAYWKLDEATGTTTWVDAVGGNDSLTQSGTVTSSNPTTGRPATGYAASGWTAGTSGNHLKVLDNVRLQSGDTNFTVAFWVKMSSLGAWAPLVSKWSLLDGFDKEWWVGLDYGNRALIRVSQAGSDDDGTVPGSCNAMETGVTFDTNWHLIVAGWDATNNRVWISVDGDTTPTTDDCGYVPVDRDAPFSIGADAGGAAAGAIDGVGYWTKQFTTSEITDLYNAGAGKDYPFGSGGGSTPRVSGKINYGAGPFSATTFLSRVDETANETGDINFSAAAWVYLTTINTAQTILGKWTTTGNQREWRCGIDATNHPFIQVSSNGTAVTTYASTSTIPVTTWTLVACGHDTSTLNAGQGGLWVSVNGAAKTISATYTSGVFNGSGKLALGIADPTGTTPTEPLLGYVDAIGFWKSKTLTDPELTELHAGGSGKEAPFGGAGGSWQTFMDATGNFYLGGSSGVLRWDAAASKLKIGPLNDDRVEVDANGVRFYTGTEASNLLTGQVTGTAWQIGQDIASKSYLTLDQTNGFRVIRNDVSGNDATAFQVDATGNVKLFAESSSGWGRGGGTTSALNRISWENPSATGTFLVGSRYLYDPPRDNRVYGQMAASATATIYNDSARISIWADEPSGKVASLDLIASEVDTTGYAAFDAGWVSNTGGYRERGRLVAMGEWSAASTTGAFGSSAGSLSGCTATNYRYTYLGKTMWIAFQIDGCALATSTADYLTILVPDSKTSAAPAITAVWIAVAGTWNHGYAFLPSGSTAIRIRPSPTTNGGWTIASGHSMQGQIAIEVQ